MDFDAAELDKIISEGLEASQHALEQAGPEISTTSMLDATNLLRPTLHIEVILMKYPEDNQTLEKMRAAVKAWCIERYRSMRVGDELDSTYFKHHRNKGLLVADCIKVADYTGIPDPSNIYNVADVELDVQAYSLMGDLGEGRIIARQADSGIPQARSLLLPNVMLKDGWTSLVFDDALPTHLLRSLVRMVGIGQQPGLNLSTFNWNRLCLLHGPPGSGKSTLCRALAQKLSIRLGDVFSDARLVEINPNAMLSKYFGESSKLIDQVFEQVQALAKNPKMLICVMMDEVETIAGSRERSNFGSECNDGLRATNQLLTALDRMRHLPNVIILCTSNLISAIDPAFLDRVDLEQYIPIPSPAAIYNIFRSCMNELIRTALVTPSITTSAENTNGIDLGINSNGKRPSSYVQEPTYQTNPHPVDIPTTFDHSRLISPDRIPTYAEMRIHLINHPTSPARRLWALAQTCQGLSGRTLRRLPMLGLARYTYGGVCSVDDAVTALEKAVEQALEQKHVGKKDDYQWLTSRD